MQSRWHYWELDKVFQVLQSQPSGITYTIARRRIRQGRRSKLFGLILVILAGILLAWAPLRSILLSRLGIMVSVVLSGHWLFDRVLTRRSKGDKSTSHKAIVKRDDRYILIPSKSLAPGDIICLQPGSEVDVDVRLVVLKDLEVAREEHNRWQIQVKDTTAPLPMDIPLPEQSNMVYHNSLVVAGEAMGVVVKTYKSPPSAYANLGKHFPLFYYLLGGWLVIVCLLAVWHLGAASTTVVYLLLAISVPWHWQGFLRYSLGEAMGSLSSEAQCRSPFLLWSLSKIKTIVVDLNTYDMSKGFDSSIEWRGLWHGEKGEIDIDIPLHYFAEGVVLPTDAALVSDNSLDQELIAKVAIGVSSAEADPALQRRCGIVLAKPDLGLLQKAILHSRAAIDRFRYVLLLNFSTGLSAVLLLTINNGLKLLTVTPVQIVWSSICLPLLLSWCLLVVPVAPGAVTVSGQLLDRSWWQKFLITTFTICGLTAVTFRFGSVSLAWTVFNFSLLALACSFCQLSWRQSYPWLAVIVICVVLQMVWIQTGRSGMLPLGVGGWLLAGLLATAVFWLSDFLNPTAENNRTPASAAD
ncbi:MAG: hypothetical protein RMK91_07505 [Pseudanabaenaceae cyanobacterium SKYGB_i_bin29]|nr:hypothetical protein [Pseudanabaenaceae cyanobacterium SKYG29]MDW8421698.1 hypothetical protein [Pseudanabaenaceae cyanobacterium SKYGB_i_bin29]